MKGKLKLLGALLLVGLTLVTYQSCSGRGASQIESYAGPGSDWDATINFDGTFTFVENSANLTISGDWINQTGPFKKFTVTTSTNPGSVAVGSQAFGLDIPGVAFILKPLSGTQIVTMVTKGDCPDQDGTMNWIITKYGGGGGPSTSDLYGVFQYDHASRTARLPFKYKLDGSIFTGGDSNLGTFNCSNSEATLTGDPNVKMYLNQVGALVNTNTSSSANAQFIIGFLKNAIGTTSALADTYYGLVFKQSSSSVSTVKATIAGTTMSVEGIDTTTGLATGSDNVTLTINSVDSPKDGFVKMTIGSDTVRCMANPDVNFTGKKLIFCAAKDPSGGASDLYNLLLITE